MLILNYFFIFLIIVTNTFAALMPIWSRNLAGTEISEGSFFALFSTLSPILLFWAIALFYAPQKKWNGMVKVNVALLFVMFFSGILYLSVYSAWDVCRAIVFPSNAIITFLGAYWLCKDSLKTQKFFYYGCLVVLAINILLFLLMLKDNYTQVFSNTRQVKESYFFFLGFPLILCLRKAILRNIMIVLFGILIFMSLKRGGILAYTGGLIAYLLVKNVIIEQRNKLLYILITPIFIFSVFFFIYFFLGDNISLILSRFDSLDTDRGSGRLDMWAAVLSNYVSSSFRDKIFGVGYYDIRKDLDAFAVHNDYIEMLCTYGLVGFSLICTIFGLFLKKIKILINKKSYYAPSFVAAFVIYFIFMNVSVLYFFISYNFLLFAYFGYVYAVTENKENRLNIENPARWQNYR